MTRSKAIVAIGAGALLVVAAAAMIFAEGEHHEGHEGRDGRQYTLTQVRAARKAAIASAGGGEMTSIESDTKRGAAFEVEVIKANGSRVDVLLSKGYRTIAVNAARDERSEHVHRAPDSDD